MKSLRDIISDIRLFIKFCGFLALNFLYFI